VTGKRIMATSSCLVDSRIVPALNDCFIYFLGLHPFADMSVPPCISR
jgi:hypothetical protein